MTERMRSRDRTEGRGTIEGMERIRETPTRRAARGRGARGGEGGGGGARTTSRVGGGMRKEGGRKEDVNVA